jgi:hypothetical protein
MTISNAGSVTIANIATAYTNFDLARNAGKVEYAPKEGGFRLTFWLDTNTGTSTFPPSAKPTSSYEVKLIKMGAGINVSPSLRDIAARVHINAVIYLSYIMKSLSTIAAYSAYEYHGTSFSIRATNGFGGALAPPVTDTALGGYSAATGAVIEGFYAIVGVRVPVFQGKKPAANTTNRSEYSTGLYALQMENNTTNYEYVMLPSTNYAGTYNGVAIGTNGTNSNIPFLVLTKDGDQYVPCNRLYFLT